jgi:site-specific recombinase XerD
MDHIITPEAIQLFLDHLYEEEKASSTIAKYARDLEKLRAYAAGRKLDKALLIAYKEKLLTEDHYQTSSINSYLIAANRFFEYMGWHELKVRTYKVQREAFTPVSRSLSRKEYQRLVSVARAGNRGRLAMILQTLCATGMRISEIRYITVENLSAGTIRIRCKGKLRTILLPDDLRRELVHYIRRNHITTGFVFRTRSGRLPDRSNLWREMKSLCADARVNPQKVFPHNFRHLFAQCFYEVKKDIAKLADVLGHSSIETTRIYIRTTSDEYRTQLNRLGLVCRS